jgi:hypothetical protein
MAPFQVTPVAVLESGRLHLIILPCELPLSGPARVALILGSMVRPWRHGSNCLSLDSWSLLLLNEWLC